MQNTNIYYRRCKTDSDYNATAGLDDITGLELDCLADGLYIIILKVRCEAVGGTGDGDATISVNDVDCVQDFVTSYQATDADVTTATEVYLKRLKKGDVIKGVAQENAGSFRIKSYSTLKMWRIA